MGEDEQFLRVLKRRDVLAIGVGSMIGFGWVVLAGEFITRAGVLGSAVAFVLGGIVVGLVGLTYAELVTALPKAGGAHQYTLRALGARWAFVTSWAVVLGYVSVVAFESVALPETLMHLFPGPPGQALWTVAGSPVRATWIAVGVFGAVVVTAVNYFGVRTAGKFQVLALGFLLVVGVLLLTGAGVGGSAANAEPLFTGVTGVLGVLTATPFLFLGFDVIPQSAEEIRLPLARIGRLLLIAVVCATAWYVIVQLSVGVALDGATTASADLPTAVAMTTLWDSSAMGTVLVLGGIAGIVTSWNGLLIGASRLLYAMACSGMLPSWFGRLHPRFRTPSNAVLFIGAISVLAPLFGNQMLTWLSNAGSANIVLGYLLVAVAFLALRHREPELARPYRVRAPRTIGVLAVFASAALLVLCLPGMPAELSWPAEWLIVLLSWAAGAVFLLRTPRVSPGVAAERQLRARTGAAGTGQDATARSSESRDNPDPPG